MVTIEENKKGPSPVAESGAVAVPETTSQRVSPLNPCSRCGNVRPLTHRVRSDLVDQTVCEACAAEVPLLITGVGELTVERILPLEEIPNAPLERDL